MISKSLMAALFAAAPLTAVAQTPAVSVTNAWSRATPPGASTGAVYLTLTSPAGDTLTTITSPAAKAAQVHEMTMDGNVMRMRELPAGLSLPPGKPVTLQPNGIHVMLVGLTAPLKQGQTVALHLTFAKSPPADVTAPVGPLGSTHAPGQSPEPAMPGMHMH